MMKPDEVAVIDLCSESSEDEEERFSSTQAVAIGSTHNAQASIDQKRHAKRPKLMESDSSNAASINVVKTNKAPLIFLKTDDTATLTIINAAECSRCFGPASSNSANNRSKIWLLFAQETKLPKQLVHIHQQDRWSCGFRNFQMMLCFLVPRLLPDHSFFQSAVAPAEFSTDFYQIPSVRDLQAAMELAWTNGFDTVSLYNSSNAQSLDENSALSACDTSSPTKQPAVRLVRPTSLHEQQQRIYCADPAVTALANVEASYHFTSNGKVIL